MFVKFILITLVFISTNVFAISLSEKIEEIRSAFPNAAMAVGVVNKDKVIFQSFHGSQNLETQTPIDEQSLFMIGSTTKAFTSTVMGYTNKMFFCNANMYRSTGTNSISRRNEKFVKKMLQEKQKQQEIY